MRLFNFENNKVENKRTSSPLTAKHLTRSAAVQSNGQLFPIFFFFVCHDVGWKTTRCVCV